MRLSSRHSHACGTAMAAVMMMSVPAMAQTSYEFDLPSQTLATSLRAVGSKGRVNIAFRPESVRGVTAPALRGSYDVPHAIDMLLRGSDLAATQAPGGSFLVVANPRRTIAPAPKAKPAPVSFMQPVSDTQTGGQAAPESAPGEIIVTAQRREQKLQDVPVSIAAFSSERLRDMGAGTITDVISQTPGVRFQGVAGNAGLPVYNIRGVTILDFTYTNEGSVAIYADDVYLGNPFSANQQLFDVERVEILRGPQGTLYGRNATGGLVHYISKRPTAQLQGQALAQYSSFDDVVLEGAVSGPVSDSVRVRVAGRYNSNDGWQTSRNFGTPLAKVDHAIAGRVTVDADLSDSVSLTFSGHYGNSAGSEDARAGIGKRNPANLSQVCTPEQVRANLCANVKGFRDPDPDPRHPYSSRPDIPYSLVSAGGFLKLNADIGDVKFTSITAVEGGRKYDALDTGSTPVFGSDIWIDYYIRHRQFSQELRLSGNSGRLEWIAGGIYYTDTRFFTAILSGQNFGSYSDQKISSIGTFAQGTYALTDTLNLTAGLRYTSDEKKMRSYAALTGPRTGTRQGTPTFTFSDRIAPKKVTWHFGADWHVTPDVMLYATASSGFKTGGYNTAFAASRAAIGPVEPETIITYEAGVKSNLLDRKLTANIGAFYSRYKSIQSSATVVCTTCPGGIAPRFLNIGNAKIRGIEAELTARPTADLTASVGAAYNKNRLDAPANLLIGGLPLNGNRLANTPKFSINGQFNWQPSLGDGRGSLIFGGDIMYQTKFFFRPDNNPYAVQSGYALVGARLGWEAENGVRVEAFAKNLFDKKYFVSQTDVGDIAPATWGMPRQLGIRATTNF